FVFASSTTTSMYTLSLHDALPISNMQIRGTSTFPAQDGGIGGDLRGNYLRDPNSPLFILNGFEVTVEQVYDLDINRIEKISVLKDRKSTCLNSSHVKISYAVFCLK